MITSNFGAPIVQVSRIDIRIDTGSKDIPAQVQMVSARWIYRNMKSVTRVAPTKQVEIEQLNKTKKYFLNTSKSKTRAWYQL